MSSKKTKTPVVDTKSTLKIVNGLERQAEKADSPQVKKSLLRCACDILDQEIAKLKAA